jgi:hypothetical protein
MGRSGWASIRLVAADQAEAAGAEHAEGADPCGYRKEKTWTARREAERVVPAGRAVGRRPSRVGGRLGRGAGRSRASCVVQDREGRCGIDARARFIADVEDVAAAEASHVATPGGRRRGR